ncbi:hypothetical protein [Halomicronema sp. CCY15110]|nr:hypothetical protein [Halomicronema sp. CCY15110]
MPRPPPPIGCRAILQAYTKPLTLQRSARMANSRRLRLRSPGHQVTR